MLLRSMIAFAVLLTVSTCSTAPAFAGSPYNASGDDRPMVQASYHPNTTYKHKAPAKTYRQPAPKHEPKVQVAGFLVEPQEQERTFVGNDIVREARRYIGTNPTDRRSLWCGAFMDYVLAKTGHQRLPKDDRNLARAYVALGTRVSGPQVGALAIMSRGKGGGHVGVVAGVVGPETIRNKLGRVIATKPGGVLVVSGNHNNTVAEAVYPRGRIYAYVMPK